MRMLDRITAILGGLCSALAMGWHVAVAQVPCSSIADYHLRIFDREKMEIEDASENMANPCTGKVEVVSIDYKPGLGFLQSFESGDIYAEVDPFVLIQCTDGRAMVKNAEEKKLICDTWSGF